MWLKRDKIVEIRWCGSSKDFVSKRKRKYFIVYSFFNFEVVYTYWREGIGGFRGSGYGTSKRILEELKTV